MSIIIPTTTTTTVAMSSILALGFLSLLTAPVGHALRIPNLIPTHCAVNIEQNYNRPIIKLGGHGNNSFIQVSATILQGIDIAQNYKCFVAIESPINTGLVWTMKRATLNDNDTIVLKSGTNNNRILRKVAEDIDEESEYEEVFTQVYPNSASSFSITYEPTFGPSQVNAGFDMVVTVFREKRDDTCGTDFDCLNDRCIASHLQCDGFNNCGNNQDEDGCFGLTSWLAVGVLIVLAIIVVVLAIFVWIRMSKA